VQHLAQEIYESNMLPRVMVPYYDALSDNLVDQFSLRFRETLALSFRLVVCFLTGSAFVVFIRGSSWLWAPRWQWKSANVETGHIKKRRVCGA
jgi:hypothetical protein